MKKLALHPQKWYTDRDIELRLGVAARHLDTQRRTVDCGGETLPYDRCVLALGANNFIPPFQGREEVPLCGLRTLDDLRRLQRLALGKERAVVIGGGVIGLELAAELVRYGLEVSVLEAMPSLMPRLIGPDISRWLQEQLPRLHIHTGVSITRLYRSGEEMVVEADGGQWTCQVLAAACGVGVPTLLDVAKELQKPGRDPRDELPPPVLRTDILELKDLQPGMTLTGTVRNVIDFGVFVDIGVHQDGLVHISQISNKFLKHPSEAVSVGDVVKVAVLEVDEKKKRISLSMKQAT